MCKSVLHQCAICGAMLTRGAYIQDELYCKACAIDHVNHMSDEELLDIFESEEDEFNGVDMQEYICTLSLEDLAYSFCWDYWEDD